ncbi:Nn.00g045930.m01.CDS01 [Neocucurbitaria sp. VM-36]
MMTDHCQNPLVESKHPLNEVDERQPQTTPITTYSPEVHTARTFAETSDAIIRYSNNQGGDTGQQQRPAQSRKRGVSGTCIGIATYFEELSRKFDEVGFDRDQLTQYDPTCEKLPPLPQYMSEFSEAEGIVTDLVRQVHQCVLQDPDQDAESTYMRERLSGVEKPAYSPPLVIGILGNSGVGKSTLINSILGVDGLCPTSPTDACTLVPMELLQMPDDQPTRYAAHIELFPIDDCIQMVRWAVKDYFNHFLGRSDELVKDAEEMDLGTPAIKTLLALFADRSEFQDSDTAEEFLKELESPQDPHVLGVMLGWTHELHRKLSAFVNKGPIFAHTAQDLMEQVESFVQTVDGPMVELEPDVYLESCVWPFVKLARITMSHPLLAKDIIVTDLPGTSDTNIYRVRATKRYLRKCDIILVAHVSTRAGDDPVFKKNIMDSYRRKKNGGVAVVVTQTDKIGNAKNVRLSYTVDEQLRLGSIDEHAKNIKVAQKKIQMQLKTASRERSTGSAELFEQLRDKDELFKLHLQHAEAMRKQITVAARNRQITGDLRSWFRAKSKSSHDLPVFCVSSEGYMKHLQPYSRLNPPDLPVELTGIVALREFMLTLPARTGKAETLAHHCANVVPGVLNAIALSCTGFKPMMKGDHLNKVIMDAQLGIPTQIRRAREDFHTRSVSSMLIKINLLEPVWLGKSGRLCDRWAEFNACGYRSFLRHEGAWKTNACGSADWNKSLLRVAAKDLDPMFDELCDKGLNRLQLELSQTLSDIMDEMERQVKANIDVAQFPAFRDFFDNIRKQKKDIEMTIKQSTKKLASDLQNLHYNCLTNSESNPFTKKMSTIYGLTYNAQPTKELRTKHLARTSLFRNSVVAEKLGPFMAIKHHIEEEIDASLHAIEKALLTKCDGVFENVLHDFGNVCPRHEDGTARAVKRRDALGKVVDEAKTTLDTEVGVRLKHCGLNMV